MPLNVGLYYHTRTHTLKPKRSLPQVVSRWPSSAAARFSHRAVEVEFIVNKVALGQLFSKYIGFRMSTFHQC